MMNPTLLILAAGMGSRYGGLKQADKIGVSGEIIMDYSIYDAIQVGFGKIIIVVRKNILSEMKALLDARWGKKIEIEYAIQETTISIDGVDIPMREKPWGTGQAILAARKLIHTPFAVINADDFYGADAFKKMSNYLKNTISNKESAMIGYILKNTLSSHGFVSRGVCEVDKSNYLKNITDRTNIEKINGGDIVSKESGKPHLLLAGNSYVSMNFWGFMPNFFDEAEEQFITFVKENLHNKNAEFYISLIISSLMEKKLLMVKVIESSAQWMGITYKEDKPIIREKMPQLIKAGIYPEKLQ